ncbi:MAG: FtsQ-type POTRA domain-containing protein [Actinomycetota bacterium]|nr:FtsQ-type POTRA domain-containing protein [Actinomycetota bacterium]
MPAEPQRSEAGEQRISTDPRIRRRRASIARSRRRSIGARSAMVAAVAAVVWGVVWSPLLRVTDVKVVGARHTSDSEVEAALRLDGDDHLLFLSTAEVARRAETLPWVGSAEVDRMLPGTVRVRIVERHAAAVLSLGAARWTLDATGHVLAAGEQGDDLPIVGGADVERASPGMRVVDPEVVAALDALASMPRSLRTQIAAVFAPTAERITLSLASGLQVRYGAAEQLRSKNQVLRSLLERIALDGLAPSYVDVRVPASPALGPPITPQASPSPTESASTG